ncbi:hypothetical protein C8R44DRAFT_792413 [Mycena epipterygia]|nr:hypothetical protein C8R44DRAFT_792413 [Mycena epipterygia]
MQARAGAAGGRVSVGPGLAARASVKRYRDLYAIQIPGTPVGARAPPSAYHDDDDEVGIQVEEWDDDAYGYNGGVDEDEREEMLGVLGRFKDTGRQGQRERGGGGALERNNSGALRPGTIAARGRLSPSPSPTRMGYSDDDEASRYPDEEKTAGRSTMYRFDAGGARDTMYSEYSSRASFLDMEKSEQARGQLVERVGVMFDLSGREKGRAVPPVPKLPAALLAAGGGNRF